MKKRTILLCMPQSAGIYKHIIRNLNHLNFEVIDCSLYHDENFKYPNLTYKIYNFLRKVFLNDKDYKKQLRIKIAKPELKNIIKNINNVDYTLVIRPDIYPKQIIKTIKQKTNLFIGYQWDGLKRYPEISKYTHYFDRFFVFDEEDVTDKNLPLTNFYFDYNLEKTVLNNTTKTVYFVGNYIESRISILQEIGKKIEKFGYQNNIFVCSNNSNVLIPNINLIDKEISFEENLTNVKKSSIMVDIVNGIHNGLSFRAFESLGYDKKLITNNTSIKKYDFYHPNNIFVIENNNLDGLEDFLLKEYIVDEKLKKKYSFTNWIHYVLGIQPYEKINLPKI